MDDNRPENIEPTTSVQSESECKKAKLLGIERYRDHNLYRFSDGSEIKVKMPERKKKRW